MKINAKQLVLYAITDRTWLAGESLESAVVQALIGGASFLQLREKTLSDDAFLEQARRLKPICEAHGVPLIINDKVDIALEVDADGVHVGQSDMGASQVRAKLGEEKILGVSCRTVEQALAAEAQGADYLGVGAMFPTQTKKDTEPVSVETLRAICQAVDIPVVAIGGLNLENIGALKGTGIAGIVVISAIFAKDDIYWATQALREKVVGIL